ncbi:hypothetical protein GIB67_032556 [Kingdonia uniflora]|uniref:Uncharacterized protein n=1 Tax=Kingdonia uniflora TaxID=39325 RepID=A0A7J7LS02_9MAGN|nr:hypothetical protein GIB67_032556 [Kingdonia uniflora]
MCGYQFPIACLHRPLKVPSRPDCSPVLMEEHENRHVTSNVPWDCPLIDDFQLMENDFNEIQRSAQYRFSRSASSPETISLNPTSYQSLKVSADDLETNSPPSVVSSLCQDREKSENKSKARENGLLKQNIDEEKLEKKEGDDEEELTSSSGSEEEEEQEEEIASSYVIEINSDRRTYTEESVAIDEAVAWAKEKFQTQNLDNIDRGYQKQSTRPSAAKPFVKREGDN